MKIAKVNFFNSKHEFFNAGDILSDEQALGSEDLCDEVEVQVTQKETTEKKETPGKKKKEEEQDELSVMTKANPEKSKEK